jgi:hypothetical protein
MDKLSVCLKFIVLISLLVDNIFYKKLYTILIFYEKYALVIDILDHLKQIKRIVFELTKVLRN